MADDAFEDLTAEYDAIGSSDPERDAAVEDDIDDELLKEVVAQLRLDIEDAADLIESDFEADRERAQKYFNGESDLPVAGENRSKYVHTKVRDMIRGLKPDIMRVLAGTAKPVQYIPGDAKLAPVVAQQTEYVTQLFHRLGGYKLIYDAAHTACLHKVGIAKVYYDSRKVPEYTSYTGIDDQQLAMLQQNPDLTVIIDNERQMTIPGPQGMQDVTVYDVDVVSMRESGRTCMKSIPIEDFLIDEWADDDQSFRVIGHRRNITVSEAVAMGFDRDLVEELDAQDPEVYDHVGLSEKRRGYSIDDSDPTSGDTSQNKFLLTEAYYRADLDDLGVAQLYRFWLGGTSYKYLDHERVDDHPFAIFAIDPEPFTVFGHSIYDIVNHDQDVMTSLIRAMVDNAHISNNPRLSVHETLVNMEDVLNNEIGAPIRNRGAGQVQAITVPFTGGQLIPFVQYLDEAVDNKVGVTRASVGLDPSAMQSTDKQAVQNTIQKQAGQIELAVRNLCETGMKRLFSLLLKCTMENPNPVNVMRVTGGYIPAPLGQFDPSLDIEVAVGVGKATTEQQMMALERVMVMQEKVMGQLGPGNPVVGLSHIMNAMQDTLETMGMHHVSRYFSPVTPDIEQKIAQQLAAAQQAAQQKPQQPDPTQAIIQAEQIKGQVKMQTDQMKAQLDGQKAQAQHQREMTKLQAEQDFKRSDAMRQDDLERDRMVQDLALRLAEIEGKLGVQVQTAEIAAEVQREQARNNRNTNSGS